MIEDNNHIELFERYRNRGLSESELKEFEARLLYDGEFRQAFEEYQRVEDGIKNHFRNELKSKIQEVDKKMDSIPKGNQGKLRILIWGSSIAAALVVGVFIFQHFSSPNYINITQQYWPHEEGLPVKMSTKGKYDDAMNAFKQEQWKKAEGLLLKIDSDTASYFLGIVSYEEKDYEQALGYFKEVDAVSVYYDEAQFRLALISILMGDIEKSKLLLQVLIENKTSLAIEAEKLLSELKKR